MLGKIYQKKGKYKIILFYSFTNIYKQRKVTDQTKPNQSIGF